MSPPMAFSIARMIDSVRPVHIDKFEKALQPRRRGALKSHLCLTLFRPLCGAIRHVSDREFFSTGTLAHDPTTGHLRELHLGSRPTPGTKGALCRREMRFPDRVPKFDGFYRLADAVRSRTSSVGRSFAPNIVFAPHN